MMETTDFKTKGWHEGCIVVFFGPGWHFDGIITWGNLAEFTQALANRHIYHAVRSGPFELYISLVDSEHVFISARVWAGKLRAGLTPDQTARLIIELYIAPFMRR